MDFNIFIKNKAEIEAGEKAGLYCVMQSNIPQQYQAFRCGLAGKPVDSATQFKSAEGNFASRFASYLNYWMPTGARVFAVLTVPRRAQLGFAERVMPDRVEGDNREEYARLHLGKTLIQIREKQYHALLTRFGMQRLAMPGTAEERKRGEFFRGPLETCIKALRAIGTGDLYLFKGDQLDKIEKITLRKRNLESLSPEQITLRANPDRAGRPSKPGDEDAPETPDDLPTQVNDQPSQTVRVTRQTAQRLAEGDMAAARAIERLRDVVPRRSPRLAAEPIVVSASPRAIGRLRSGDSQVQRAANALQQVRRRSPRLASQDVFIAAAA